MKNDMIRVQLDEGYHSALLEMTRNGDELKLELMELDGEVLTENSFEHNEEGLLFAKSFVTTYIAPSWWEQVFQWMLSEFNVEIN